MTNIHDWARDKRKQDGITTGPHNSQIAFLERGDGFDPKIGFWESLETFNLSIANKEEKFTYVQSKIVRERLLSATPFLNEKGHPADFIDFIKMVSGRAKINSLYLNNAELTDELCSHYGHSLEAAFNKIARERMLNSKKAWLELIKVDKFPQDPKYQAICQDVLRGEHELTKEETLSIVEEYAPACGGQCPCYHALEVLADDKDDPVDISDLKQENKRLLDTVSRLTGTP